VSATVTSCPDEGVLLNTSVVGGPNRRWLALAPKLMENGRALALCVLRLDVTLPSETVRYAVASRVPNAP
jgi:hypothetical protein